MRIQGFVFEMLSEMNESDNRILALLRQPEFFRPFSLLLKQR